MINIAIVDDDMIICEIIKEIISKQFINEEVDFRTYMYQSSNHLLSSLNKNSYDIILLDIDMPGINGLQTSKILREKKSKSIIIFVTSKISYMADAFGLNVYAFIDKKNIETDLVRVLKNCITELQNNELFAFKTNEGYINCNKEDIVAAVFENRKVSIYEKERKYAINHATLKEFYDMVDSDNYIYINRGTIINLKYLKSTRNGRAHMQGLHEVFFISKERIKEVNYALMKYIAEHGILR